MEGGGPVKLTHLGLLLPMSVHGCWLSFVGDHLCSQAVIFVCGYLFSLTGVHLHGQLPAFVSSQICLWVVVSLMQCGDEPLVVGPCSHLCHCVVGMPCCHYACVMAPASGVRWAWLEDSCTYLNSLDSDDRMYRHHLDNMAHLPHHLHHPLRDVAMPCCCCSQHVCCGGCDSC